MKKILITLLLITATSGFALDTIKFIIKADKKAANETKLKAVTREIWGASNNRQLPENWSSKTEQEKVDWAYSGWVTVSNATLGVTNAQMYCVTKLQTANFMTSNKWNVIRNDLKPLKYGQDYIIEGE